jgi:hypothetical protein
MKLKTLLIAGVITAIAVPVAGAAKGGTTRDSVTGGGQAFLDSRDANGAGDTVAFQAQRSRNADDDNPRLATGQIQVNRRGTGVVKFHGTITCMAVNGDADSSSGSAYMSGEARDGTPFELYVTDGGRGTDERGADMIMLFYGTETANNDDDDASDDVCGFGEFDPEDAVNLARGNVQVRNRATGDDGSPPAPSSSTTSLSLAGLL